MTLPLVAWVGLASALLGSLSISILAAKRVRVRLDARAAAYLLFALALLLALYGIDIPLGLRFAIRGFVADTLNEHGLYSDRKPLQVVLSLFVIGGLIFLRTKLSLRYSLSGLEKPIAFLASCFVSLWLLEAISLHDIDALLYKEVYGMLVIGWLWVVLGALITVLSLIRFYQLSKA